MSRQRSSPRKFSEKIALLNKKEAEHNAEFEKIIKEVEETTRAPANPYPMRTSSFSNCCSTSRINNSYIQRPVGEQAYNFYQDNNIGSHHNQSQPYHYCNSSNDSPSIQHQHVHQHQHQQHSSNQLPLRALTSQTEINVLPCNIIEDQQSNSPGVPNIKISTIDDSLNGSQQLNFYGNIGYMNPQSTISSARSLPDITNLRVSGTLTTPSIVPSLSDQRLHADPNQFYDTNSNLVPNNSNANNSYCSTIIDDGNTLLGHPTQHQQQVNGIWLSENNDQERNTLNHRNQETFYHQHQHQLHHNQTQNQGTTIVRANSFNTVSNSWHDGSVNGLSAPIDNNNLSKSSEGYYSLVEDYNPPSSCPCPQTFPNSQSVNYPMVKSSSHNNIDNIHLDSVNYKNHNVVQQVSDQMPSIQMLDASNHLYE